MSKDKHILSSTKAVIEEILSILETANYIDPAEHLYDGIKQINREITDNTLKDFLWALESSTVMDIDGDIERCIVKLKTIINDN